MRKDDFFQSQYFTPQRLALLAGLATDIFSLVVLDGIEERENNPIPGKRYRYVDILPKVSMIIGIIIALYEINLAQEDLAENPTPTLKWLFYMGMVELVFTFIKADILFFQTDNLPQAEEDALIDNLLI